MKKLTRLFALSTLWGGIFLFFPAMTFGATAIEIAETPNSFTATIAENFKTTFHFFYSGSGSGSSPRASIADSNTPNGIALGTVVREGTNTYSVEYSGVPKKSGIFPLTLILSDDSGLAVTKHFTVTVSGFVFMQDRLLNAIINQPYSASIRFSYLGSSRPRIRFYDLPENFQISYTDVYGENGNFNLLFTPRKTGTFSFKGEVTVNSIVVATGKIFTVNVVPLPIVSSPKSSAAPSITTPTKQKIGKEISSEHISAQNDASSSENSSVESEEDAEPQGFFSRLWQWLKTLF